MTKDEKKNKAEERAKIRRILDDALGKIEEILGRAEHEILCEPRVRREYEAASTSVVSTMRFMMIAARDHLNRWF